MTAAYEQVGFFTKRSSKSIEDNRQLRKLYPKFVQQTQHQISQSGASVKFDQTNNLLVINDEMAINLTLAKCTTSHTGNLSWKISLGKRRFNADLTLAIRLTQNNDKALDYYLLPQLDLADQVVRVSDKNHHTFECFRFEDLSFINQLTGRSQIT